MHKRRLQEKQFQEQMHKHRLKRKQQPKLLENKLDGKLLDKLRLKWQLERKLRLMQPKLLENKLLENKLDGKLLDKLRLMQQQQPQHRLQPKTTPMRDATMAVAVAVEEVARVDLVIATLETQDAVVVERT
jgi:hypothetical protein